MLKKIEIRGFRSIKNASIELGKLNVLIGANGAGKSNFISFFKMLNEMMAERLQQYIGTTGWAQSFLHFGPKVTPKMEAHLYFEPYQGVEGYFVQMKYATIGNLMIADEGILLSVENDLGSKQLSLGGGKEESPLVESIKRGNQVAIRIRGLLDGYRVYHFHDTSPASRIRQPGYIRDNRNLLPDAGNLAAMLHLYQSQNKIVYERIVSTIQYVMPDFGDFVLEPDRRNPNDILLNWHKRGHDYLFGPHQISDGTLRAMAIIALLLQPKADLPGLIVLDEPELGLHPYALEIVAGLIRAASVNSQVIVATQSQTFLDCFEPSEIITVESRESESVFRRLNTEELKDWLEDYSVGELWQRNVFVGGGPMP